MKDVIDVTNEIMEYFWNKTGVEDDPIIKLDQSTDNDSFTIVYESGNMIRVNVEEF